MALIRFRSIHIYRRIFMELYMSVLPNNPHDVNYAIKLLLQQQSYGPFLYLMIQTTSEMLQI